MSTDIFDEGTPIIIRTLEGDSEMKASKSWYLRIGVFGEVYTTQADTFSKICSPTNQDFDPNLENLMYLPTVKNKLTGESKKILKFAKICMPLDKSYIYAKSLVKKTKLLRKCYFYMNAEPGDYIAVRASKKSSVYIISRDMFEKTYEIASECHIQL